MNKKAKSTFGGVPSIEKRILLQEKATKITRIPVINDKEYKILFYKRIAKKLIRSSTRVFKSRWGFV